MNLLSETIILVLLAWLGAVTLLLLILLIVICCLSRRNKQEQRLRRTSGYNEYVNSYHNAACPKDIENHNTKDIVRENDNNGDLKRQDQGLGMVRGESTKSGYGWMGSMREDETTEYTNDTILRAASRKKQREQEEAAKNVSNDDNENPAEETEKRLTVSQEELHNYWCGSDGS